MNRCGVIDHSVAEVCEWIKAHNAKLAAWKQLNPGPSPVLPEFTIGTELYNQPKFVVVPATGDEQKIASHVVALRVGSFERRMTPQLACELARAILAWFPEHAEGGARSCPTNKECAR